MMTDAEFIRASELKGMERTSTFLLGCIVGVCLTMAGATLWLVVA